MDGEEEEDGVKTMIGRSDLETSRSWNGIRFSFNAFLPKGSL